MVTKVAVDDPDTPGGFVHDEGYVFFVGGLDHALKKFGLLLRCVVDEEVAADHHGEDVAGAIDR